MAEITRKQIERAIAAHDIDKGGISEALGGWGWDAKAPDYVREKWRSVDRKGFGAALARWRDSLPVAKVARWVPEDGVQFVLTPPHMNADGEKWYVTTREQAIAWGYTLEGGPEVERAAQPDPLAYTDSPAFDEPAYSTLRPPAPEVVDVPQPVVKRCGGVAASWQPDGTCLFIDGGAASVHAPLALLRAMLEAIDAQQGGAS